jgi:hypothetical protein
VSIDRSGRDAATPPSARRAVEVPVVPEPTVTPEAVEFVRFCYRRSAAPWPDLYDDMCAAASRGAFRGLGYDELSELGISFALTELPRLAAVAQAVIREERSRPVPALHPVMVIG